MRVETWRYLNDFLFEFIGTAACGEDLKGEGVKMSHHTQVNEILHLWGRKTNEMQIASTTA